MTVVPARGAARISLTLYSDATVSVIACHVHYSVNAMDKDPPPYNWNNSPVVVLIYVAAALVTIGTGVVLVSRWAISKAPSSPQPMSEIEPEVLAEATPTPIELLSEATTVSALDSALTRLNGRLERAARDAPNPPKGSQELGREDKDEKQPVEDIRFECQKPANREGEWSWDCYLTNSSDNVVWWRNTFSNKGSELRWSCWGDLDDNCTAHTLEDDKIILRVDQSIRFDYLNPNESFHLWINCPKEPSYCGFSGRAPGLVVGDASFHSTHR
jgi:hypothetical protein